MHTREIVLILPNIRSCHNVGAMFRTADACAVSRLYLVGYTPTPPKPQIDKVSLGAETWIPWEQHPDTAAVLRELHAAGYTSVALEKTPQSASLAETARTLADITKVALVVGNEVDGIDDETLGLCHHIAHIPMLGKKESLNVSVAVGIALYLLRA